MTQEILTKVKKLKPGEQIVYYTGFMDFERWEAPNSPTSVLSMAVYSLAMAGQVYLTQKRISPPVLQNGDTDWSNGIGVGFQYIATGASLTTPPQARIQPKLGQLWRMK